MIKIANSNDIFRNIDLKTRKLNTDLASDYIPDNKLNSLLHKLYKGVQRDNVIQTTFNIDSVIKFVNPIDVFTENQQNEKLNVNFNLNTVIYDVINTNLYDDNNNKINCLFSMDTLITPVNNIDAYEDSNNIINANFIIDCIIKDS